MKPLMVLVYMEGCGACEEAKPEFRSRTADRMDERDMEFKKGGKTKAYAKGGSVRGAGIAQRGVRKCKVY